MTAKEADFNGHPTISLLTEDDVENGRHGFSFGTRKARLILEHLDEIRAFAEKHTE